METDRPEVDEVLVGLLSVERAEDRREATRLIGLRRGEEAAPNLQIAAQDHDGSVRVQAIKMLTEIGDPESLSTFITALDDASAQVAPARADGVAVAVVPPLKPSSFSLSRGRSRGPSHALTPTSLTLPVLRCVTLPFSASGGSARRCRTRGRTC